MSYSNLITMKNFIKLAFTNTLAFQRCCYIRKTTRFNFDHQIRTLCTPQTEVIPKKNLVFKPNTKAFLKEYPGAVNLLNIAVKELNLNERAIMDFVYTSPKIATFDPIIVTSNLRQLMVLGFEIKEIIRIVEKYPHLLEYEGNQIYETFESWRNAGLPEKYLWSLFARDPLLFSISNDEVQRRVKRLFYFMQNKINRVLSVIELNPAIMYGNWDDIEDKFRYIYYQIRTTEKDISRSKALSLPLSHIKLRYSFLDRCGIYRRPTIKEKKGFNPADNPPLASAIDTDDDYFATSVAKVSADEFQVFKKLMKYKDEEELGDPLDYSQDEVIEESDFDVT